MNFFNRERKLFGDRLEPDAPKLSVPLEATSENAPQEDESHEAENAKQGTLIFTNRASLFSPEALDTFFNHISALIRGEKKYGRVQTSDTIRDYYEQGRCVIGTSDCQVWGYACVIPINHEIDVLEATIRRDFQNTQPAKQLVELLAQGLLHPEKTAFALSWTSYTKRLFGKLGWLPCQIKRLDCGTKEALTTYDEFVERYNIFMP
jgi:hypothetical protein